MKLGTATVSATGHFKGKTNYLAKLTISHTGRYRLRAKLVWTNAKGVVKKLWSTRKYFRVYK